MKPPNASIFGVETKEMTLNVTITNVEDGSSNTMTVTVDEFPGPGDISRLTKSLLDMMAHHAARGISIRMIGRHDRCDLPYCPSQPSVKA